MTYFPPAESSGGWRTLSSPADVREFGGFDPELLRDLLEPEAAVRNRDSWGLVVVRHGYIAAEYFTYNISSTYRFDIYSSTKSFTGTVWGMLLDDIRAGRLPNVSGLDLDSPVYPYLPEGYPLSDPRKESITLRHLLTMTSGIAGELSGIYPALASSATSGPFEFALGHLPNRFGEHVGRLIGDPGSVWQYSDPGFIHLALLFEHVAGRELADFAQERLFGPIGLEQLSWSTVGGSGFLGPHTNSHTGIMISARELARLGYLYLQGGRWENRQLVPSSWIEMASTSSQALNPEYGYTFWTNATGTLWPDLPRDAFAMKGYRSNRCLVIPSLDLVIARVGSGPIESTVGTSPVDKTPEEVALDSLLSQIAGAIIDN